MENKENKGILVRIWTWFKNLTVKGLLRAIFIAFIIIIIFITVSYLPSIISRVSSSLSAALYSVFVPAENATMTADKKIINSGEDFTVSFKTGDAPAGIFTVAYDCDPNLNLYAVESNGLKNIECNSPYYVVNNNSLKIRAITKNENVVRLTLVGALENNDTQKSDAIGVARITITNNAVGTTVNIPVATTTTIIQTTKPVTPTYIPAPTPTYYGKPDLVARVLQVGLLSTGSNYITPQTNFSYYDTVGIKFEVRNDGDATAGTWYFTASLPSVTNPQYTSPTQVSLRPGESIQFTLGFSNLSSQYSNLITINVDPANTVYESNEGNNMLSSTVTNTGYNNNYYNYNNNGCYVNGAFTYNCAYNNNNYYNYGLTVSCYANPTNPDTDEKVHWYANAYGGDGDYDYDWTGTNNLDSSSQNPTKTYSSEGTKFATVTVTDGDGRYASQTCSTFVSDNGNNSNDDVDLDVQILAVGRMNSSGNFIEDDNISEGDDAAVQFRVRNEGNDESGNWDYEVDLTPSFSGDTYERSNMSSLSPGESMTVTVQFNDIRDTGTNTFRVEVDPNDDIDDNNRDNNDDSETIHVD
jgi:hypothetical protein